ncbi:hypothetical protein B0H12DRAFT_1068081 [Mycena haematopus]|nr:hypothetical protein B0H12DRAFT_1068081 [Mycena haematopus]
MWTQAGCCYAGSFTPYGRSANNNELSLARKPMMPGVCTFAVVPRSPMEVYYLAYLFTPPEFRALLVRGVRGVMRRRVPVRASDSRLGVGTLPSTKAGEVVLILRHLPAQLGPMAQDMFSENAPILDVVGQVQSGLERKRRISSFSDFGENGVDAPSKMRQGKEYGTGESYLFGGGHESQLSSLELCGSWSRSKLHRLVSTPFVFRFQVTSVWHLGRYPGQTWSIIDAEKLSTASSSHYGDVPAPFALRGQQSPSGCGYFWLAASSALKTWITSSLVREVEPPTPSLPDYGNGLEPARQEDRGGTRVEDISCTERPLWTVHAVPWKREDESSEDAVASTDAHRGPPDFGPIPVFRIDQVSGDPAVEFDGPKHDVLEVGYCKNQYLSNSSHSVEAVPRLSSTTSHKAETLKQEQADLHGQRFSDLRYHSGSNSMGNKETFIDQICDIGQMDAVLVVSSAFGSDRVLVLETSAINSGQSYFKEFHRRIGGKDTDPKVQAVAHSDCTPIK